MRLANKRIFVVGDDAQHNAAIRMLLGQHRVTLRVEGFDGETMTRRNVAWPADLILLDPMCADLATRSDMFFNILRAVRRTPALADVPAVAMSCAEPAMLIPSLREVGYRGFLRKPLNCANFANQIADILDGKQVWEYR